MGCGLYTAVCGDIMQERRMEILTNNLANVSTAGFKEDRPSFAAIYPEIRGAAVLSDQNAMKGFMLSQKMDIGYPAFSGVKTDFSNGAVKHTGGEMDVAINGPGFFVVTTPEGEFYTRMGNFSLNDKNELVTQGGYPVKGNSKIITIKGTEISFSKNGAITMDGEEADTLKVVDFKDYAGLMKVGDNLFKNPAGKSNEQEAKGFEVKQNHLELSNINIVKEMVKMIDVIRICESYQKVIHSLDEIDAQATREVGSVA